MEIPNFRYLQDVKRFLITMDQQVEDNVDRVKNQTKVNVQATNWGDRLSARVNACTPRVTEHNIALASTLGREHFRIISALEKFVITDKGDKSGGRINVDTDLERVVVPNLKDLKTQYGLAEALHQQYITLDSVETQVTMQFRDSRDLGSTLKSIRETKAKVEVALRKCLEFLASVAAKHVPEAFMAYVNAIGEELSEHVVFRDSRTFVYANISEGGSVVFTAYLLIEDALNEDGELTPSLYVAVQWNQGANDPRKGPELPYIKVWLDHDFEMPQALTSRPDGLEVSSSQSAVKAVGRLLALENFSSSIGVIPLNLQLKVDPSAISKKNFSFRDYVQSVQVDNNILRFVLARVKGVDKDSVQKIGIALYPEVKQMLRVGRKAKLRMKIYRAGDNWNIDFLLTDLAKPGMVSVDDLEFLKDKFDLDDRKLSRIAELIG